MILKSAKNHGQASNRFQNRKIEQKSQHCAIHAILTVWMTCKYCLPKHFTDYTSNRIESSRNETNRMARSHIGTAECMQKKQLSIISCVCVYMYVWLWIQFNRLNFVNLTKNNSLFIEYCLSTIDARMMPDSFVFAVSDMKKIKEIRSN